MKMKSAHRVALTMALVTSGIVWAADEPVAGLRNPDQERLTPVPDQDQQIQEPVRPGFFIGNIIPNLRGLDPAFGARTLTLVDPRRVVSTSSQAEVVDLNNIPSNLLDRMDVVNYGKAYAYSVAPGPRTIQSAPAASSLTRMLPLPVAWTGAPLSERFTCGPGNAGCSRTVDLLSGIPNGASQLLATGVSGDFVALPHSRRVLACGADQQAGPLLIDLAGNRTVLPAHPGALRACASTGTGDEVLLVYEVASNGKSRTLARVFDASGALLVEDSFRNHGTLRFKVAGKPYSAKVPGP